jgi:hypothetical protein
MKEENSNRTRIIGLRLTPDEYAFIEEKWKASTCRKLSDYIRRSLFERPVMTTYRNKSQDDIMTELTRLRGELNGLGNNFNQAVKKLHTLQQIPEFKAWVVTYELERRTLQNKLDEVRNNIKKMLEIWLQ